MRKVNLKNTEGKRKLNKGSKFNVLFPYIFLRLTHVEPFKINLPVNKFVTGFANVCFVNYYSMMLDPD